MYAKELQGTPRNAKGTPMKGKAKGMSCFLLFRGLKRQIFEFCYFIKCS